MKRMSMTIHIEFAGDVDRLPHKDLAEHTIKLLNEAIKAKVDAAGPSLANVAAFTADNGTERRHSSRVRPLDGSAPYFDWGESVTVDATWTVHLGDPR